MIFHLRLAVVFAFATWIIGWWGVAIVALIAGVIYRGEGGRAGRVALAAAEGWAMLLLVDAVGGRFGRVATTIAGAMSLPAAALLVVTLLFPALIGWSGATAASSLTRGGARAEA